MRRTDHFDGRIIRLTDPKYNLVLQVVLQAVAAKSVIDLGIDPFHRFQDGNWREVVCLGQERSPALFEKAISTPKAQDVIGQSSNSTKNSNRNYCEQTSSLRC
jgi:hypothetical protein